MWFDGKSGRRSGTSTGECLRGEERKSESTRSAKTNRRATSVGGPHRAQHVTPTSHPRPPSLSLSLCVVICTAHPLKNAGCCSSKNNPLDKPFASTPLQRKALRVSGLVTQLTHHTARICLPRVSGRFSSPARPYRARSSLTEVCTVRACGLSLLLPPTQSTHHDQISHNARVAA
jgi:hypothetical protein